MTDSTTTEKIRHLNDCFRRSMMFGGTILLTPGIGCLSADDKTELLSRVRHFDSFTGDNDPHGEHNFGAIDLGGARYFWKIDYYDLTKTAGSPDPADPTVTHRVMTIMRADEY